MDEMDYVYEMRNSETELKTRRAHATHARWACEPQDDAADGSSDAKDTLSPTLASPPRALHP